MNGNEAGDGMGRGQLERNTTRLQEAVENREDTPGRRPAGKGRAENGHDRRTSRTTVECVEQFRRYDHGVVCGLRTRPFTTQPLEPAVLERELEIHVCVVFIRIQIYIRRN